MKSVLITGANSFVGMNVENWLKRIQDEFEVATVDTMNEAWKQADYTKYDVVFHVAGIAHVDPKPEPAVGLVHNEILEFGVVLISVVGHIE